MFRDPLGPSRSPIDYGSTPFATITRSYIDSVLTTARQTVYTPPPSDYERAVQSGQSTYDWSRSTTREAKNIHRNWTKVLEETIRHVCNTQTAKGKDSGTRNKPNISVADFRKIEEANKYGLTVAEKAKIDKMSMSDLKSQYSSVIGNYNTYIGTGYFNPLGIGENRAVIERYKILKAEEEAKAAAQAAELAKYQAWNIYDTIRATGLKPDGSKPSKAELDIANSGWYPWLKGMTQGAQLASSISSAYVGYQSYYGKPILGVDTNYIQTAKAKINEKLFNFDDIDSGFKAIDTDTLPVKIYSDGVPDYVDKVVKEIQINKGNPPEGYKGGKVYNNLPKDGGQKLPEGVRYREYDVHPKIKGVNRGTERVVIGDDGAVWYTDDHYETFTKIE
ncbi:TPA: hypothetical protein U0595_002162 [Streptococcus suis]|nr:hypothetical protein [Streptococcus suis]HEM2759680.1 hypothetical protein [Streptococcus suis]HEM2766172.1 hypothetical protein [Streptococcus suis]